MDFNETIKEYQKTSGHTVNDSLLSVFRIIFNDIVSGGDIADKILCAQQGSKI